MTVDEQDLRDLADELRGLYRELDALKYSAAAPRETRVMKPRPGPSAPGNWFALALDRDMTADLFEMVRDAANHVDPTAVIHHQGRWLCEWIRLKSFYIVEDFPAALELHELMVDQARRLTKRLHPPEPTGPTAPEKHVDIETITRNLNARGHTVTPRQARDVAAYNRFALIKFTDGRNGYLLSEFLRHYEKTNQC